MPPAGPPMREDQMDAVFAALSDRTRRSLLAAVARADGEGQSVTDLAEPFVGRMSLQAVSKHLSVLEGAGLVVRSRDGRLRRCTLDPRPLAGAAAWLEHYHRFWTRQLDQLAAFVEDAHAAERRTHQPPRPSAPARGPHRKK